MVMFHSFRYVYQKVYSIFYTNKAVLNQLLAGRAPPWPRIVHRSTFNSFNASLRHHQIFSSIVKDCFKSLVKPIGMAIVVWCGLITIRRNTNNMNDMNKYVNAYCEYDYIWLYNIMNITIIINLINMINMIKINAWWWWRWWWWWWWWWWCW